MKCDERQPKPKHEKTEIPERSLQIIHKDKYTINGQTNLTMIEKFYKSGSAYWIIIWNRKAKGWNVIMKTYY